jgi:cytochrome P450
MNLAAVDVNDDLLNNEIVQNPSPYYSMLREQHPCFWNERWRGWVLSRYDDVYFAMHSPKFLADRITPWYENRLNAEERERYKATYEALHSFVVFTDPPDHTRLRRIFGRAFTPKAVMTMKTITEEMVHWHLDKWESGKTVDLNADLAYPLPANVISTIIGARREDLGRLQNWAEAITTLLLAGVGDDKRLDRAQSAFIEFKAYLKVLYGERVNNPQNDMMSWLMEVQRNDPLLTEDDVLHSCIILLNAGHETTQTLICNTLTTLLELPDELEFLRKNPQSMKTAIEEGLRYNGPLKGTIRLAGEDIQMHDKLMRKGDRVLLLMGAANRDPAKFQEPERFIPTRDPNPHLSFSHGIHFCLGAPLARMEAEMVFNELLRRFPKMKVKNTIRWEPRILGRSIAAPIQIELG